MCHRIMALRMGELIEAMERRAMTGRATVTFSANAPEAYPGSSVPLLLPSSAAPSDVPSDIDREKNTRSDAFVVKELIWGFESPKDRKLVFNTRLDTALHQAQKKHGLWAEAILSGRCLVPVRGFYETSRSRYTTSPVTGKKIWQQFLFQMPYHQVFLLAGVAAEGRFSIVTCEPNRTVGAVHTRMPLVLSPGESVKWLWADFASLADRSGVELSCVAAL